MKDHPSAREEDPMSQQSITSSVSPRRQRRLGDMAMRGLREKTQRDYIRLVRSFAAFLKRSPDTATAEDIHRSQVHQAESGVPPPTINCSISPRLTRHPQVRVIDRGKVQLRRPEIAAISIA
jgi:hypothetical protein